MKISKCLLGLVLFSLLPGCLSRPELKELRGAIGDRSLWGFEEGEWWEVGSGLWTQEGAALQAVVGKDPNWTWISSPHPYPDNFELSFEVYGEARFVGVGFGPFKDFVVPKAVEPEPLSIRFVLVDGEGQLFADGKLVDSPLAVRIGLSDQESYRNGRLQLKIFRPRGPMRFDRLLLEPRD